MNIEDLLASANGNAPEDKSQGGQSGNTVSTQDIMNIANQVTQANARAQQAESELADLKKAQNEKKQADESASAKAERENRKNRIKELQGQLAETPQVDLPASLTSVLGDQAAKELTSILAQPRVNPNRVNELVETMVEDRLAEHREVVDKTVDRKVAASTKKLSQRQWDADLLRACPTFNQRWTEPAFQKFIKETTDGPSPLEYHIRLAIKEQTPEGIQTIKRYMDIYEQLLTSGGSNNDPNGQAPTNGRAVRSSASENDDRDLSWREDYKAKRKARMQSAPGFG